LFFGRTKAHPGKKGPPRDIVQKGNDLGARFLKTTSIGKKGDDFDKIRPETLKLEGEVLNGGESAD